MKKEYLTETEIIPYHTSPPHGEKVLVLSPHPDDETLGCGGTIRLLVELNRHIKVVFLTSGDKADPSHRASLVTYKNNLPFPPLVKGGVGGLPHTTDYTLLREKEAEKALRVLEVSDYEFLRFPDRGLFENYEDALERLVKIIEGYIPDTVYSPSPLEINPDHRATANVALELQKKHNFRIVFYEVATPIRPNKLIDITKVIKIKWRAIKSYKSQLKIIDYLDINKSLNKFRALTLDKKVQYAEAFLVLEAASEQEMLDEWFNYRRPL